MSWKNIETSREIRLWVSKVIIPAAMVGTLILGNETTRIKLKEMSEKAHDKLTSIFKK